MKKFTIHCFIVFASSLLWTGCGNDAPAPRADKSKQTASSPAPAKKPKPSQSTVSASPPTPKVPPIKPLTLGALGGGDASTGGQDQNKSAAGQDTMNSVLEAMKPLQIFLGDWNTTTRNMGADPRNGFGIFAPTESSPPS